MKKQMHILEGLIILTAILISGLLIIKFIYHINHEKMDTTYMWNIKLTNLNIKEGSKEGIISLENNLLTLNLVLEEENEFYEFTLDIVNDGTLSAVLENINFNVENEKGILIHSLTYLDQTEIKKGDILNSNETKTIRVRIDYPKQEEKIYESLKLNMTLKMQYKALY